MFVAETHRIVEVVCCQMPPSIERPPIGILQQPHSKCAPALVKTCQGTEEVKEYSLDDLLRLAGITHDFQSDTENQLVVPVEKHNKGIVSASQKLTGQFFVAELVQQFPATELRIVAVKQ